MRSWSWSPFTAYRLPFTTIDFGILPAVIFTRHVCGGVAVVIDGYFFI